MQRIDLRAAVGIRVGVGVVAGGGVGLSITACPSVRAAFLDGYGGVHGVVNGQMQGINLRAAVAIRVAVSIVAGGGVGLTVAACPSVRAAFLDGYGNSRIPRRLRQ